MTQRKLQAAELGRVWWVFTWRHHAVGVGGGGQAVAAAGVVHEDGQRRVEAEGGEGVGAESLTRHGAPAGRVAYFVWLPLLVGSGSFMYCRLPLCSFLKPPCAFWLQLVVTVPLARAWTQVLLLTRLPSEKTTC